MDKKHIELLKDNLDLGHWVECKDKDGNWRVLTWKKIVGESTWFFLEKGLQYDSYVSESYLQEVFTNEYKIIARPLKRLEIGDLVEVLDTPEVRDFCYPPDCASPEFIGMKNLVVNDTSGFGYVLTQKSGRGEIFAGEFPHWAVAKCLPEEEEITLTDDELLAEVKRRGLVESKDVLE